MDTTRDSQPPRKRRPWLRALKGILVTLAVVAAALLLFQASYLVGTARMVPLADRLRPLEGWKPDGENVNGGIFCIGIDVPCDSMWRRFRTQQPVTAGDILRISSEAGLTGQMEGDCGTSPLPSNVTGMYVACKASGVLDGYDVEIRVLKLAVDDPERIIQCRLSSVRNR
ncbi:hypothetical protein NG819_09800 [Pseudarthrobacter sp. Fe7]|nr:hypothetical protein NG819_09800 [Pseudarthrobacter sp. Fe7]